MLYRLVLLGLAWAMGSGAFSCLAQTVSINSLGMRMVRVEAGEFWMGNEEPAERLRRDFPGLEPKRFAELSDEGPVHRVRITRPFWMGQHEVTVGQFRRFLGASGYVPESVADGTGGYGYNPQHGPAASVAFASKGDAFEGRDVRYAWHSPGFAQGDDHPVVNITWNDAQALAAWLSKTEGQRYRLPTEAEWEYACRAGSRQRFQVGDDPRLLSRAANLFDQDALPHWAAWHEQAQPYRDGHAFTAPVGQFAPNAWGLHDMHGNVWEWVSDWYDEDYYRVSPLEDPQGPADGRVKVRRGGSWHSWSFYSRASYRNWNATDTRYTLVGVRLVREIRP